MVMKIVLDTNFLLIPGTLGVDIFSEISRICDFKYKLCIFDKTVDELNKVMEEQSKFKKAAKMALDLVEANGIEIIEGGDGLVDDIILEFAKKEKIIVATQDKGLKLRLKDVARLIVLRQKKYLILV